MENIEIVFFGTPEFAATILKKLLEKNFKIKTVVTNPDKAVGRKQILTQSEVAKVAEENHIICLKPTKLDDEFIDQNQQQLKADLYIVAAYGKIMPKKLLEIPKFGAINVHGSMLPMYRGASPIQQSILDGQTITGVTIMAMDEKMDHGGIISRKEISLEQKEDYLSLSKKMSIVGADLLIAILPYFIKGKIDPIAQIDEDASYTKLIKKDDGFFEIDNPPPFEKLDQMIRAYFPWPNVWTKWQGKIVKFYPNQMIQIEGKNPVKLNDFLRGYPEFPIKEL